MSAKRKVAEPCLKCGGYHFGTPPSECPFISGACVICGIQTIMACSDCAIASGGKSSVHVCGKTACRDEHEKIHVNIIASPEPEEE